MQRTLKFLVIFMGILILAALAVIIATVASRMSGEEGAPRAKGQAAGAPPEPVALGLPEGSSVAEMQATDDRLVLRVRLPEGGERIVILDLESGALLGTVDLGGAP